MIFPRQRRGGQPLGEPTELDRGRLFRAVGLVLALVMLCGTGVVGGNGVALGYSRPHYHVWNPNLLGVRQEIRYEQVPQGYETLYLFHPRGKATRPRPVLVYIHGGALIYGSAVIPPGTTPHDRLMVGVERQAIHNGWDFVSVNYRLAPEHRWPIPLLDVKHAIRYLQQHAGQLGINAKDMAVMGDSAGGELSTFVGLTMREGTPHLRQHNVVRAVVDLFGPVNREGFASTWRKRFGLKPNPIWGVYSKRNAARDSAINYVHKGAPPFLIVQGTQDKIVPPNQSRSLAKKLLHLGVPAHLIMVKHAGHELVPVHHNTDPNIPVIAHAIVKFLTQHLTVVRKHATRSKEALTTR